LHLAVVEHMPNRNFRQQLGDIPAATALPPSTLIMEISGFLEGMSEAAKNVSKQASRRFSLSRLR
jgi:hypothetical protein